MSCHRPPPLPSPSMSFSCLCGSAMEASPRCRSPNDASPSPTPSRPQVVRPRHGGVTLTPLPLTIPCAQPSSSRRRIRWEGTKASDHGENRTGEWSVAEETGVQAEYERQENQPCSSWRRIRWIWQVMLPVKGSPGTIRFPSAKFRTLTPPLLRCKLIFCYWVDQSVDDLFFCPRLHSPVTSCRSPMRTRTALPSSSSTIEKSGTFQYLAFLWSHRLMIYSFFPNCAVL
jgi:hypothetical protein